MALVGGFMVPHPPMIIPGVGKGSEITIKKTIDSYEEISKEIASLEPDTIIISSPHSVMYSDYFHISPGHSADGSFVSFGDDKTHFNEEYDVDLVLEIEKECKKASFPAGTLGEKDSSLDHGTMVPLYFIRKRYHNFKIVRIGLSGLSLAEHYQFGMIIQSTIERSNKRIVYIASGDLSHKLQTNGPYGFVKEGPIYDERIIKTMSLGNFGELLEYDESFLDKVSECGHRSFTIMAGVFDGISVQSKFYSHEDITGVGYGICSYYPEYLDNNRKYLDRYLEKEKKRIQMLPNDSYVSLARKTIHEYIKNGKVISVPNDLPMEFNYRAGVFVSLHKFGLLRGCIGTFLPVTNSIAEEIIRNAIASSTEDDRFSPVRIDELDYLEINVDVLSTPEKISSIEELNPKKYGVIVSSGFKRGLLLPDLDGIDTIDKQISIARRKGNIKDDEEIRLERFEVIRHR